MSYMLEIEADLDWREAELASLRILMVSRTVTAREKRVLYRAAWSLLYAHYEGFCKFALTVYYDRLSRVGITCNNLPEPTKHFALSSATKSLRNKPLPDLIESILRFQEDHLNVAPQFPEVSTDSNLWPSVLENLLECADLQVAELSENKFKLKTLVGRRNKIAHGERDIIVDFPYYETYERAFREVAYNLALKIDEKLSSFTAHR